MDTENLPFPMVRPHFLWNKLLEYVFPIHPATVFQQILQIICDS